MSTKQRIVRPIGEWLSLLVSAVISFAAWGCATIGWHPAAMLMALVGFTGLFTEVANRVFYDRPQPD